MKTDKQTEFDVFKKLYRENTSVKYATIIVGGVLLIFLSGKAFNGIATVIRSFNNMKSAINGK